MSKNDKDISARWVYSGWVKPKECLNLDFWFNHSGRDSKGKFIRILGFEFETRYRGQTI